MIFKTRKPKRNHHAPGFGPGFLFAKKGAKHRGRARRAAAAQSEACDAKRGRPPKRVRSTEDEDGPERATAVRSPRRKAGQAAKRVRSTEDEDSPERATAARSPRRKAGRAAKRVRSTEDEDSPERATAVRSLRREAGQAAKKGAKPATRRGTGCWMAFYIRFP